jgi:hypothetical protein
MNMNAQFDMTRFNTFVAENRIIHGAWKGKDAQGRETACLLSAFADGIDSAIKCPAEIMPSWFAHLTPWMTDNFSNDYRPEMINEYARVANGWHVLSDAQWMRVKYKALDAAMEVAEPHDTANAVAPVRALLKRAISGDVPSDKEWRDAAARATARAATFAAARAATFAAAFAACAAAFASYASYAVRAAADAASYAVRAAACDKISKATIDAISIEIELAGAI